MTDEARHVCHNLSGWNLLICGDRTIPKPDAFTESAFPPHWITVIPSDAVLTAVGGVPLIEALRQKLVEIVIHQGTGFFVKAEKQNSDVFCIGGT